LIAETAARYNRAAIPAIYNAGNTK
jgi:hypothetical protein